jgi:predicted nucleotidyltransferase component of viral defense system
MDFDEKDKEFGQFQTGPRDNTKEYEEEFGNIYAVVDDYVKCIMKEDAKSLVNTFSPKLIEYVGLVNAVSFETAKEIAEERIIETFEKTDIKDLYDGWQIGAYDTEITRIRIFSQRAELKDAYLNCGIKILDAVDVDFKVITGGDERKARIRLVKNTDGNWIADADYFF